VQNQLVSIIMPAYNCEAFVQRAIDSILQQTHKNFELLIADDASKDGTKKIIDAYQDPRIKLFHNEKNLGYTQASNKLFSKCQGDYITFQDADDYSAPNRLELLVNYLEVNKEAGCVGSNIAKVDEQDKQFYTSQFPLDDRSMRDLFRNTKIVMTGSSLMARRSVTDKIGLYHLYFDRLGSEDVYWFSRILSHYKVGNVSEVLYFYRANPNSVTSFFKNPKTTVLHNLIVLLFKRREGNQSDYLMNNEISKADAACQFFLSLDDAAKSKLKSFVKYFGLSIQWPSLGSLFFRDFMYKLIKQ
jgi:glycosyltransferase involved in cell wall biosynthesis